VRVREPEPLHGLRVVATPAAIDAITGATVVMRTAPDEAIVIGLSDIALDDPFAIVAPESAFVGWWLEVDQLRALVEPRAEWSLPRPQAGRATLAQGLVAGVPMKVWFGDAADGGPGLLVVSRSLAHEAQDRLFGATA
jgi:hypothetical protein